MNGLRVLIAALALAGCAAQQQVQLLPRGDAQRGTGQVDRMYNTITVELGGQTYSGPIQPKTTTHFNAFGMASTSTSSESSALLVGAAGQIRCDFGWNPMTTAATGVCTDNRNATYDLLISQ